MGEEIYCQVPVLSQPFLSDLAQVNSLETMSFPKNHEDNFNFHILKPWGKWIFIAAETPESVLERFCIVAYKYTEYGEHCKPYEIWL